jgi:hypothetical protein
MSEGKVVSGNANLPERLYVHSLVRRRQTRMKRWTSPTRHRFTQRVLPEQRRLVRGRPLDISRQQLLDNLDDFQKKNELGFLEIRTKDGRLVNLVSLEMSKPKPPPPKPHPPMDSVERDAPSGLPLPQYIGGRSVADPVAGRAAAKLVEEKKEEAARAKEPPSVRNPDPSESARKIQVFDEEEPPTKVDVPEKAEPPKSSPKKSSPKASGKVMRKRSKKKADR